jgi:hypothetical protein
VVINAAVEMLCRLIVSTDRSTAGGLREGIEEGIDFEVRIVTSPNLDAETIHMYRRDVTIPKAEKFRKANGIGNEPTVLLMDNCSAYTSPAVIELPSQHRVKAITFPLHTSGIFQMFDLVFFGVFKGVKKHLARDPSVPIMADHAMRLFRALESAGASSMIRGSFTRAESLDLRVGGYSLAFHAEKICATLEFREV